MYGSVSGIIVAANEGLFVRGVELNNSINSG